MTHHDRDILVVTSDPEFRVLARQLLSRIGCAIREAETGEDGLALAQERRPGCVILDVLLPDMTGYAVCQELRELFGDDMSIIFVSGERTEPSDRVAGLLLGADDYVVRPFDSDEFVARARRALARAYRPAGDDAIATAVLGDLTAREREVLGLLAEGHDQTTIAGELVLSPATVSTHIQRILSKLGVHSRAQAVAVAHLEKLVELPAPSDVARSNGGDGAFDEGPEPTRPGPLIRLVPSGQPDRPSRKAVTVLRQAAPAQPEASSWWLDPATARARVSAVTGELTNVTNQWAGLMRWQPDQLVGRHFMDFVLPEARADASAFFDLVRQRGEIASRAIVRRGDGSQLTIEVHAVANGEFIDVAYRPVSPDGPVAGSPQSEAEQSPSSTDLVSVIAE